MNAPHLPLDVSTADEPTLEVAAMERLRTLYRADSRPWVVACLVEEMGRV